MMSKEMKIAQKLRDPLELKPHLFTKICSVSPKMKSSSQKKSKNKIKIVSNHAIHLFSIG